MKNRYLNIMERSLEAYSLEHMQNYFHRVKTDGLKEHGFPRLAANMGILIARGRKTELLPLFCEMMDFCCQQIPLVKAANDFSVREVVCCLEEVEAAAIVPQARMDAWKAGMATIVPQTCYNCYVETAEQRAWNWALFTGVSEFYRNRAGLGDTEQFIEAQVGSQMRWLDENGMYMDHPLDDVFNPMTYDMVVRGLFSMLLYRGYRGKYYRQIDEVLRKAGLLTLKMLSVTGEPPFGGRSNQFLLCETWLITICEFEANRYAAEGDMAMAGRFKAAAVKAAEVVEEWLKEEPIRHIKNYFPTETRYGCEDYAYFDKYMITTASNLYGALMFCDESIPALDTDEQEMVVAETSYHFHKVFMKNAQYAVELDTNGDIEYDASGLGRVHKVGAPSAICLSVPCPMKPSYVVDAGPRPFCIGPAICLNTKWLHGCEHTVRHEVQSLGVENNVACTRVQCTYPGGQTVMTEYALDEAGVHITITGEGRIGCTLPAFYFDGAQHTQIEQTPNALQVYYKGHVCRYTVENAAIELITLGGSMAANRNGHYKRYLAAGEGKIQVHISIDKV